MKIIAVSNRKGGVGKTTTAINLGAALAGLGWRTLLIDLDEQGNMTESLGVAMRRPGLAQDAGAFISAPKNRKLDQWDFAKISPNLWLLPSHEQLGQDLLAIQDVKGYDVLLRDKLAQVASLFDFVLIDCPPSFTDGTAFLAFTAATAFVVPTDVEPNSVRGLKVVMEATEAMAFLRNKGLKFAGFVCTRFNPNQRGQLKKHLFNDIITAYGEDSLLGSVRQDVALTEAQHQGETVFQYAPSSRGAQDYAELATALLKRI